MYPDVLLYINGTWTEAADGRTTPVVNPAAEEVIGAVAHAGGGDRALPQHQVRQSLERMT
jgi:succinate-semialdehyde dehydrogenase/glutarate-semialdehyde dehydrogenase